MVAYTRLLVLSAAAGLLALTSLTVVPVHAAESLNAAGCSHFQRLQQQQGVDFAADQAAGGCPCKAAAAAAEKERLANAQASAKELPLGHPPVGPSDTPGNCPFTALKQKLGYSTDAPCPFAGACQRAQALWATLTGTQFGGTDGSAPSVWLFLFSEDPKVSAFLATLYISLFPNLILFFVPPNISPQSLNILVSFAVGGLLGDVFLHLLPHSFAEIVHFPPQDHPRQTAVIGVSIFLGLMVFFAIDKLMRMSGGGHDHSHGHGHGSAALETNVNTSGQSTAVDALGKHKMELRQRSRSSSGSDRNPAEKSLSKNADEPVLAPTVKFSAYLNIIADATHNFTDGLAMAASFYSSPAIGISTTIAVFFHEIPHEIGDYAILVQSGLPRRQALLAQFVTALGAFAGTAAGVLIQEMGKASAAATNAAPTGSRLLGGLGWGDLVIPFTAGGFIYIATAGVLPDLLNPPPKDASQRRPFTQALYEFGMMLLGLALMLLVSGE
ncbi:hypothetical protein H4R34_002965 [Dimargaris verticillata]|uniref:ZIP zinc transporter-domain-containing protein n=1 Tax=Dimargaris verticillata TaxID=2761393 RepID=A0A9W8EDK9_9FUNG|nr:hypothetical protein H4R34_002965 [Dimargaris verticillata]